MATSLPEFSDWTNFSLCEDFLSVSNQDQASLLKQHKISPTEFETILEILERKPTMAELGVFSAMWSEHCSYKSSRVHLRRLPSEGEQVVVGPGENAGIIRLSNKLCVAFKMESHNHPSYIEPYQGAATGVGGILRDVFCMGARPVANLNALRFGRREHPRTHYLLENVVKGIGDYGNCVGIPTVSGNVSFHASYDGNCLVNAMTVGLIHEDRIFKGYATGTGNLVIYVGSATGRDGIHGATMASDSFEASEQGQSRTTVQVGDPFAEKLLLEATLELLDKDLIVGLQDMGAAGLTSSSFEMADRAGSGLYLDLDRVPVRAANMSAYELLLSESQERMLLVAEPTKWPQIKKLLEKWDLSYDVIGQVTDTGRVQISYQGNLEVDVPVQPLAGKAPVYDRPRQRLELQTKEEDQLEAELISKMKELGIEQVLTKFLAETGSKQDIYRQYDHHIGTKTILGPEQGGAGLLWIRSDWADADEPYLGLAVASTCPERYCGTHPYEGAAHAVLRCARSIAATGARGLAITDCLNFGNPEDPKIMEEISMAIDGIAEACKQLATPVVSGNVSLYNTTGETSILPTPMIGMVGKHPDVRKARKAVVEEAKGFLALLAPKDSKPRFGGSLANHCFGGSDRRGKLADLDWQAELDAIAFLMQQDAGILSAKDVADGGYLTCCVKMILGASIGLQLDLSSEVGEFFGERSASYVLQFADESSFLKAQSSLASTSLSLSKIGELLEDSPVLKLGGHELSLSDLVEPYASSLRF